MQIMKPPTTVVRKCRLSHHLFTVFALLLYAVFFFGEDLTCIFDVELQLGPTAVRIMGLETKREELPPFAKGKNEEGCDVFSGRWIFDESTLPLYEESECPYIQQQLTCQEHGRPDKDYQKWRWQPHGCDLPSFNATLMLETLRGKRVMFVGDSLNRGQFASMICLLHSVIPSYAKSMESFDSDSRTVFTAKEYNATIEFYWAPFLLESNSDDAVEHRVSKKIVRKGSINKHGKHWEDVDILVLNTYLWWMTARFKFKILLGSFDDEVKNVVEMPTMEAYRMAMNSLVRWVQKNMDPEKTRVFFTSMSPVHGKNIFARSTDWGGEQGGSCYKQTTLSEDPNYKGSDSTNDIMQIIGEVFNKSKVPITFLNITHSQAIGKMHTHQSTRSSGAGCPNN